MTLIRISDESYFRGLSQNFKILIVHLQIYFAEILVPVVRELQIYVEIIAFKEMS